MNGGSPQLSRRSLVVAAGAGLLTAACTSSRPARSGTTSNPASRTGSTPASVPPSTKDAAIFDLSFTEQHRYRPFHVVAPEFVQDRQSDLGRVGSLTRSEHSPPAPFAAVEVDVANVEGVVGAGRSAADRGRGGAT